MTLRATVVPSARPNAMADDLEQQVIDIITRKQKLEPGRVTLDSTFEELAIDSLDGMDLLFVFEDTFHIDIPDDLAHRIKSVRQAVEGLRALVVNRSAEAN